MRSCARALFAAALVAAAGGAWAQNPSLDQLNRGAAGTPTPRDVRHAVPGSLIVPGTLPYSALTTDLRARIDGAAPPAASSIGIGQLAPSLRQMILAPVVLNGSVTIEKLASSLQAQIQNPVPALGSILLTQLTPDLQAQIANPVSAAGSITLDKLSPLLQGQIQNPVPAAGSLGIGQLSLPLQLLIQNPVPADGSITAAKLSVSLQYQIQNPVPAAGSIAAAQLTPALQTQIANPVPAPGSIGQGQLSDDVTSLLSQIGDATDSGPPVPTFSTDLRIFVDPSLINARVGAKSDFNVSGQLATVGDHAFLQFGSYPDAGTLNGGVGLWSSRTEYFPNNAGSPGNATVSLPAGTYALKPVGAGASVAASGGASCTASQTAPCVFNLGSAANVTLAVSGSPSFVHLERCSAGSVSICGATGPIQNVGTGTSTRNADAVNLALAPYTPTTAGSFYFEFTPTDATPGVQYLFAANAGGGTPLNDRVACKYYPPGPHTLVCEQYAGGSLKAFVSFASVAPGTLHKVAIGYDGTGFSAVLDGALLTKKVTASVAFSTAAVGSNADNSSAFNGYVSKMQIFSGRLSDGDMIGLTAGKVLSQIPSASVRFFEQYGQSNSDAAHATDALTTTPPDAVRNLMPNDTWGVRGPGPSAVTSFQNGGPGITAMVPCVEANGTGSVPSADYGETEGCGTATGILAAHPDWIMISRGNGSPGRVCQTTSKNPGLDPGSTPFNNRLAWLDTLKKTVPNAIVLGSGLDQGGTDAETGVSYGSYAACLLNIETTWNNAVKSKMGQSATAPTFVMQVPNYSTSVDVSAIDQAQLDLGVPPPTPDSSTVTAHPDLFVFCGTSYPFGRNPNFGPHYTNTSQQRKADMRSQCVNDWLANGDTAALWPTSIVFAPGDRSKIDITWHAKSALQFNPQALIQGAAPNHGFQFSDTCNDGITAVGFTITGTNKTQMQLSAPVGSGCAPRVNSAVKIATPLLPKVQLQSMSWSGGTATVTTTAPHNLTIGRRYPVVVTGSAPAGFNTTIGSVIFITPTDANTLTYPVTSNPGTMTTAGSFYLETGNYAWTDLSDSETRVGPVSGFVNFNWAPTFNDLVAGG